MEPHYGNDVDEVEERLRGLLDDVGFLLDEKDIEHDAFLNSDGEDGWHLVVTAGHEVHGSPLREYTLTYSSAEAAWSWQATAEDGDEQGPHAATGLDADASPVDVAEHIAAELAGDAP